MNHPIGLQKRPSKVKWNRYFLELAGTGGVGRLGVGTTFP